VSPKNEYTIQGNQADRLVLSAFCMQKGTTKSVHSDDKKSVAKLAHTDDKKRQRTLKSATQDKNTP